MLVTGLPVATGQFGLAQTEGVRRKKRRKRKRKKKQRKSEESQRYCPTEKKRDELVEREEGG